ncbi:hypothetical protein [Nocardioides sp. SYSU D00038]|uniref:hypothetical protein n=1 Tax=Nocardioides sp. SYSU D00038 TaxID=2812554 RepID=UPI001967CB6A|nr:hypothetical protein [Nocardioides sp. SYSU D00038]
MNPVTGLSLGRIAVGTLALARPDLAAQALQLDARANPQLPYLSRMFGSREIAIGLATLFAKGRGRTGLVTLGIAVDAADLATGLIGPRQGEVPQRTGLALAAPAAGAVLAGVLGLRTTSRADRRAARKARRAARKAA